MAYHPAHDTYFEDQVLTATPQKLRWMAIDGAIRFCKQASEHWRHERIYEAGEALIGCQRLLIELMSAVKPERAPSLAPQVANLYAYISRLLNESRRGRDPRKLAEVIEILEIERETWRLVCEQLGARGIDALASGGRQPPGIPTFTPHAIRAFDASPPSPGFTASA